MYSVKFTDKQLVFVIILLPNISKDKLQGDPLLIASAIGETPE
jgi:hypothetical protein